MSLHKAFTIDKKNLYVSGCLEDTQHTNFVSKFVSNTGKKIKNYISPQPLKKSYNIFLPVGGKNITVHVDANNKGVIYQFIETTSKSEPKLEYQMELKFKRGAKQKSPEYLNKMVHNQILRDLESGDFPFRIDTYDKNLLYLEIDLIEEYKMDNAKGSKWYAGVWSLNKETSRFTNYQYFMKDELDLIGFNAKPPLTHTRFTKSDKNKYAIDFEVDFKVNDDKSKDVILKYTTIEEADGILVPIENEVYLEKLSKDQSIIRWSATNSIFSDINKRPDLEPIFNANVAYLQKDRYGRLFFFDRISGSPIETPFPKQNINLPNRFSVTESFYYSKTENQIIYAQILDNYLEEKKVDVSPNYYVMDLNKKERKKFVPTDKYTQIEELEKNKNEFIKIRDSYDFSVDRESLKPPSNRQQLADLDVAKVFFSKIQNTDVYVRVDNLGNESFQVTFAKTKGYNPESILTNLIIDLKSLQGLTVQKFLTKEQKNTLVRSFLRHLNEAFDRTRFEKDEQTIWANSLSQSQWWIPFGEFRIRTRNGESERVWGIALFDQERNNLNFVMSKRHEQGLQKSTRSNLFSAPNVFKYKGETKYSDVFFLSKDKSHVLSNFYLSRPQGLQTKQSPLVFDSFNYVDGIETLTTHSIEVPKISKNLDPSAFDPKNFIANKEMAKELLDKDLAVIKIPNYEAPPSDQKTKIKNLLKFSNKKKLAPNRESLFFYNLETKKVIPVPKDLESWFSNIDDFGQFKFGVDPTGNLLVKIEENETIQFLKLTWNQAIDEWDNEFRIIAGEDVEEFIQFGIADLFATPNQ